MKALSVMPGIAARGGGPVQNLFAAIPHLKRLGWDTTVFATDAGGPAGSRRGTLKPEDLPPGGSHATVRTFPMRPPVRLAYSPALGRAVHATVNDFDLVRIHSLYLYPHFAAGRAAERAGVPYMVSLHGALDPWMRSRGRARKAITDLIWGRRLLDRASAIHVATTREAELTADIAPHVPREIVPNGIDLDAFADLPPRSVMRDRLALGTAPVVLFHGRIAAKKGLDILIEAMAFVRRRVRDARLVIVGPDDEGLTDPLQRLANAHGLSDVVTFTGPLFGEDRIAALATADVWALPSHTENFGSAVIEAAAAGLPVVISHGVNLAPEIERLSAGRVEAPDAAAVGSAIADVLEDAEAHTEMSRAARGFAAHYGWDQVAPQMVEVYSRVSGTGAAMTQAA